MYKQQIKEYRRLCLKCKDESTEVIVISDVFTMKFKTPTNKLTIPKNSVSSKKLRFTNNGSDLEPTKCSNTSPVNCIWSNLIYSYCRKLGHSDERCFKKKSYKGKKQVFCYETIRQPEFAVTFSIND